MGSSWGAVSNWIKIALSGSHSRSPGRNIYGNKFRWWCDSRWEKISEEPLQHSTIKGLIICRTSYVGCCFSCGCIFCFAFGSAYLHYFGDFITSIKVSYNSRGFFLVLHELVHMEFSNYIPFTIWVHASSFTSVTQGGCRSSLLHLHLSLSPVIFYNSFQIFPNCSHFFCHISLPVSSFFSFVDYN